MANRKMQHEQSNRMTIVLKTAKQLDHEASNFCQSIVKVHATVPQKLEMRVHDSRQWLVLLWDTMRCYGALAWVLLVLL